MIEELAKKYPHVATALKEVWGTPLFAKTIQGYFMDTRDATRRGFPHDVVGIFFDLMMQHDIEFPHLKVNVSFNGIDLDAYKK